MARRGRRPRPAGITRAAVLLREWRAKKDWSQTKAAEVLGLTDGRHLDKLERGQSLAGLTVALRIASATGGEIPVSAWAEYTTVEARQAS